MCKTLCVISNSHLTALARAAKVLDRSFGIQLKVNLFSPNSICSVRLNKKYISCHHLLPKRPSAEDYLWISKQEEFLKTNYCLLFYTRLVDKCLYRTGRLINFHPSLLPHYPGLNGYEDSVSAGELAITAHRVSSGIDDGEIILQHAIEPFPSGSKKSYISRESSRLCSAVIIRLLFAPVILSKGRAHYTNFVSGKQSICKAIAGILPPDIPTKC